MKTKFAFSLALLFLFLKANFLFDKIQIENAIKEQIKVNLSLTLPKDEYLVFVSAEVDQERIQEIDKFEEKNFTERYSYPRDIERRDRTEQEIVEDYLPGFVRPLDNYNLEQEQEKEEQYTKEEYNYIEKINLKSLLVTIVFDESIPDVKKNSIIESYREKIKSYGDNSKIFFRVSNLKEKKELTEELRENPILAFISGLIIFFISLLLLLLLILFLYFIFRLFTGGRKEKDNTQPPFIYQTPPPPPQDNASSTSSKDDKKPLAATESVPPKSSSDENLKEIEEMRFVNQLLVSPLVSRKYFLELSKDEREKLYSSFDSVSVHNVLEKLGPMGLDPNQVVDEDLKEEEKIETIRARTNDLKRFTKIVNLKIGDKFGKLSLLTKGEVKRLFNELPLEDQAVLLKNIEKNIAQYYISQIGDEKRGKLLEYLNREIVDLPGHRLVDLESNFNVLIDQFEKNVFTGNPDKIDLSRSIVEASPNPKAMVNDIKEKDEEIYEELKYFVYDENDLLAENDAYIQRLLEKVKTEDLAKATFTMEEGFKNKIMNLLTEDRREFVDSLIATNKNTITKEESTNSLNKGILTLYREMKTNEI